MAVDGPLQEVMLRGKASPKGHSLYDPTDIAFCEMAELDKWRQNGGEGHGCGCQKTT